MANTFGTLKFKLNTPLPSRTALEDENGDISDVNMIHDVKKPDRRTYRANFSGSLPQDAYNSQGQAARTVDTIVQILDNLLTTAGM